MCCFVALSRFIIKQRRCWNMFTFAAHIKISSRSHKNFMMELCVHITYLHITNQSVHYVYGTKEKRIFSIERDDYYRPTKYFWSH